MTITQESTHESILLFNARAQAFAEMEQDTNDELTTKWHIADDLFDAGLHIMSQTAYDYAEQWQPPVSPDPANPEHAALCQDIMLEYELVQREVISRQREKQLAQEKTQAENIRQRAKMTHNPLVLDGLAAIARAQNLWQYVSKVIAANDRRVAQEIRNGLPMSDGSGRSEWVTNVNRYKQLYREGLRAK